MIRSWVTWGLSVGYSHIFARVDMQNLCSKRLYTAFTFRESFPIAE